MLDPALGAFIWARSTTSDSFRNTGIPKRHGHHCQLPSHKSLWIHNVSLGSTQIVQHAGRRAKYPHLQDVFRKGHVPSTCEPQCMQQRTLTAPGGLNPRVAAVAVMQPPVIAADLTKTMNHHLPLSNISLRSQAPSQPHHLSTCAGLMIFPFIYNTRPL